MLTLVKEGLLALEALGPFLEDKLSLALWVWDFETGKTRWSSELYRLLGLTPEATVPSYAAIEGAVHIEDRKPQSEIESSLRASIAVDRRLRVIRRDGSVRWIRSQLVPIMNTGGILIRAVGVCADITQTHNALQIINSQAQRFASLCRTRDAFIWAATPDGGRVDVLNRPPPDTGYPDLRALMHPDDRIQFDEAVAKSSAPRDIFRLMLRLKIDDRYLGYASTAMPLVDDRGRLSEWVGMSCNLQRTDPEAKSETRALTGAQIRAGRAIARWSVSDLAAASQVSASVIRRLEEIDGAVSLEPAHLKIETALRQAGVEFSYPAGGKPGVRPR